MKNDQNKNNLEGIPAINAKAVFEIFCKDRHSLPSRETPITAIKGESLRLNELSKLLLQIDDNVVIRSLEIQNTILVFCDRGQNPIPRALKV